MVFNITSKHRETARFASHVQRALHDMRALAEGKSL